MKYNGKELKQITEVVAFEEPKEMLVWSEAMTKPTIRNVSAVIKGVYKLKVICSNYNVYSFCAEIPKPTMRDMTREEMLYFLCEKNKSGCVVARYNGGEYIEYKHYSAHIYSIVCLSDYTFATMDKTGKITEFKIPQVEDK